MGVPTYRRDELRLLGDGPPVLAAIMGHAHRERVAAARSAAPLLRLRRCVGRQPSPHPARLEIVIVTVSCDEQQGAVRRLSDVALLRTTARC